MFLFQIGIKPFKISSFISNDVVESRRRLPTVRKPSERFGEEEMHHLVYLDSSALEKFNEILSRRGKGDREGNLRGTEPIDQLYRQIA